MTKQKAVIMLSALSGMLFMLEYMLFMNGINDLADIIELTSEDKQPHWLRSRYKPVLKDIKNANDATA